MKRSTILTGMALALSLVAGTAQAAPLKVQGGTLVLPTSGIAITVADDPARDYMLSGSWALTEEGTFDSRDVVDELDAKSGNLVRGNWILTGYFDAGNCDKLLAGLGNKNAWTAPVTLWGSSWQASGGDYTFSTSLGTHPMAALCRIDGDGRGLLLQRFVVERPAGMTKAALLAELGQARVLAAAAKAFAAGSARGLAPLRQGNVTNRGKVAPNRAVRLEKARLDLTMPDDGMVWLVAKPDPKRSSDMLDRVVPSLPEVSVEVLRAGGMTCPVVFGKLTKPKLTPAQEVEAAKPMTGLPAGWAAGPVLASGAQLERIVCMVNGTDAVLAGMIAPKGSSDATPIAGLLNALTGAKPF